MPNLRDYERISHLKGYYVSAYLPFTSEIINLRPAAQPLPTWFELEYNACASR
jgi:hypothetical protein